MEHPLIYNPTADHYYVGPTEMQRKVALIHGISIIQERLGKGLVGEEQFEQLMSLPLSQLIVMVNDQAEVLRRAGHNPSEPLDYE